MCRNCGGVAKNLLYQEAFEEADRYMNLAVDAAMDGFAKRSREAWDLMAAMQMFACWPSEEPRKGTLVLQLFDRLMEISPDHQDRSSPWFYRGLAYFHLQDWAKCVEALNTSMRIAKENGDLVLNYEPFALAVAYHHLGNESEAKQWYERGVEWFEKDDPDDRIRQDHEREIEYFYRSARRLWSP